MLKSITYYNGASTIDFINDPAFRAIEIQGVCPSNSVNSTSIAGFDGATYLSEQMEKRTITMIIGFFSQPCFETGRHTLYDIFRLKSEGTLRYSDDLRDLSIKCRVLTVDIPFCEGSFKAQVQLECDDPYFYADEIVSYIAKTIGAFEFPFETSDFSLIHNGDFVDGLNGWDINTKYFEIVDQSQYLGGTPTTLQINSTSDAILSQELNKYGLKAEDVIHCQVNTTMDFVFGNPTNIKICGYTNDICTVYENSSNDSGMGVEAWVVVSSAMLAEDKLTIEISGIYNGNTITNVIVTGGGSLEFGIITDSLIARVENNGEIPTGCKFTINAVGNCVNPKIQNINTFEWMQINVSMVAGDQLVIDTQRGQKSITFTHNGVSSNYIHYKLYGSVFLQLAIGANEFRYSAAENEQNLEILCTYTEKYGGV